jgi:hypothetical protein
MITTKQAETILPTMRAAVAALHEVWEKCRERNVDNLVWQDNGKVKCNTCGMRYRPPSK